PAPDAGILAQGCRCPGASAARRGQRGTVDARGLARTGGALERGQVGALTDGDMDPVLRLAAIADRRGHRIETRIAQRGAMALRAVFAAEAAERDVDAAVVRGR